MNEIKCPHCGEMFTIDESAYADIVRQVRSHEFEKELLQREKMYNEEKQNAIQLAKVDAEKNMQQDLAKKEAQIAELKMKIMALEADIRNEETKKALAVSEAVRKVEIERDGLKGELKTKDKERELLEISLKDKYNEQLMMLDEQIAYY